MDILYYLNKTNRSSKLFTPLNVLAWLRSIEEVIPGAHQIWSAFRDLVALKSYLSGVHSRELFSPWARGGLGTCSSFLCTDLVWVSFPRDALKLWHQFHRAYCFHIHIFFTCIVWPKRRTAPFLTGEIKFAKDVTRARGRIRLLLGSCKL